MTEPRLFSMHAVVGTYAVPILVVSGIATAGLIAMTIAPRALLHLLLGAEASDAVTIFLARYTGLLVFVIGALIVYSAYHPEARVPILIGACVEKLAFIALVLSGRLKRTPLMIVAATADGCFTLLYIAYLVGF